MISEMISAGFFSVISSSPLVLRVKGSVGIVQSIDGGPARYTTVPNLYRNVVSSFAEGDLLLQIHRGVFLLPDGKIMELPK